VIGFKPPLGGRGQKRGSKKMIPELIVKVIKTTFIYVCDFQKGDKWFFQ